MSFLKNIIGSITDFSAYRDFVRETPGRAIKYFFLIFTLLFVVYAIQLTPVINGFINDTEQEIRDNVPDFRIVNGELEVKSEMPYIVKGNNNSIFIVDTTGELDQSALDEYSSGAFVGKTQAFVKEDRQGMSRLNTINFSAFKGTEISRQSLLNLLPAAKKFIPLILLFVYIFGFLSKMVTLLVLALIGLAIKGRADFRFGHMWSIACHAITLPLLLKAVKDAALPQLPWFTLIYFGVAIFYMYKGIQAAKEHRDEDRGGPVIPV